MDSNGQDMSEDATSLPQADIVKRLDADPRPAWLWSADGGDAVWANTTAALFGAKLTPDGLQRREPASPIKGQIARILRLGLIGSPTRSRMQFIAGRKPLSATCHCTPLKDEDGRLHLLVVSVDPINEAVRNAAGLADGEDAIGMLADAEPAQAVADAPQEPLASETPNAEEEPETEVSPQATESADTGPAPTERKLTGLSDLVDKLAGHEHLFDPLGEEDDAPFAPESAADGVPGREFAEIAFDMEVEAEGPLHGSDWGDDDPLAHEEAAFAADSSADKGEARAGLWQIAGRGLTIENPAYEDNDAEAADGPSGEQDVVEQTSRYNFEELSRILTDRVGREEPSAPSAPHASEPSRASGALVALSDEALVLNRLPIGILIFRDQDVLFVNRALVDLTGHQSATALRSLGLAAVLPTVDAGEPAGPVTHLVRRDGEKVTVSARLNSISWQGRPAFMLSARSDDIEPLREAEVQQFAALWAQTAGFDFLTADRSGVLTHYAKADAAADAPENGAPITALIAAREQSLLRRFFELPARYAGGVRPAIALRGAKAGQRLTLFAEGRAGIVTGYFGLFGPGSGMAKATPAKGSLPSAQLSRITRGLRRPLNTISGFSELMASEAFGPLANARYLEYARDIRAAGADISDLADELDDYVRLAEGELELSPADIDIGTLLAECLVRVRSQASKQRVLLRSAISEKLPMVRADAATLKQAVLNMLASAISEGGEGSKVVLTGQHEDDGAVTIHVRDAAKAPTALAERFVVFRDGLAADGSERRPSASSIGLTLTRSLVAVNACSLSLEPASEAGTLMTLTIPASLVVSQ